MALSESDSITVNPEGKKGAVAMDLNINDKLYVNSNDDGTVQIEFSSFCEDTTQNFKMRTTTEGTVDIEFQ